MNAGNYLTHLLTRYDVDCVFGIPGVHTLELYRALNDAQIKHITPRHEQGAGFMADGYARVTGKPGVCFIISGPGMTNIATAMGQAYSDSIPMLVISTVNSHGRMGSGEGWLHELPNQQALVSGVCEFSHTIHCASEIPQVLARAFAVFDGCRPRPVHIEIPINVLMQDAPAACVPNSVLRLQRGVGNLASLKQAANALIAANKPVILVGGGAARTHTPIQALAEAADAPVVMTVNARGLLASSHPLAVPASASLPEIRELIAESDVVLAIGTEMGPTDYDFNEDGEFVINGTFIRIEIDAQQMMRSCIPDIGIVGDAKESVLALLPLLEQRDSLNAGAKRASHSLQNLTAATADKDNLYVDFLSIVNQQLDNPVIVGDSTQIIYASNSHYGSTAVNVYFNSAMGFGTLGYALPAAIGAALGNKDKTVVAISGDGGLQFCLSELTTAVDANIRLVLIVHENGGYKEIKKYMTASDIEPVGVDLLEPDITAIAKACGWATYSVANFANVATTLDKTKADTQPSLVLIKDSVFDTGE
ncbi:MAG: 5-guanidino-2-oxopentanoate decarboxylase [Granulosicoccus sp.]